MAENDQGATPFDKILFENKQRLQAQEAKKKAEASDTGSTADQAGTGGVVVNGADNTKPNVPDQGNDDKVAKLVQELAKVKGQSTEDEHKDEEVAGVGADSTTVGTEDAGEDTGDLGSDGIGENVDNAEGLDDNDVPDTEEESASVGVNDAERDSVEPNVKVAEPNEEDTGVVDGSNGVEVPDAFKQVKKADDQGKVSQSILANVLGENISDAKQLVNNKDRLVGKFQDSLTEQNSNWELTFEDADGNVIQPRNAESSRIYLDNIPSNKLIVTDNLRKSGVNLVDLEDSIKDLGLLTPLTVVPVGKAHEDYVRDDEDQPVLNEAGEKIKRLVYQRYYILDGCLRYSVLLHLNYSSIPCVVNETIPIELVTTYMTVVNNHADVRFSDRLARANLIRQQFSQDSLTYGQIEKLVGFKTGEYFNGLFIDSMKTEYPNYYKQVEEGKMSITQAYNKLSKEIEKQKKTDDKEDNKDSDDITKDEGNDKKDDLTANQQNFGTQNVGSRHILDAGVRRTVESRDLGMCKICGFPVKHTAEGKDVKYPDLSGTLEVEHLCEIQYFSRGVAETDDPEKNLYLICPRCHTIINRYRDGNYSPSEVTIEQNVWLQKALVAGNMKLKQKQAVLKFIKENAPDVYKRVTKGKLSIGKGLLRTKAKFNPYKLFDDEPLKLLFSELDKIDAENKSTMSSNAWEVGDDPLPEDLQDVAKVSKLGVNQAEQEEDGGEGATLNEQKLADDVKRANADAKKVSGLPSED